MSQTGLVDWNLLADHAKQDLAHFLLSKAMTGLASSGSIFATGVLGSIASWGLGLVIAVGIKYGDWGLYMVADAIKNKSEGIDYEKAALQVIALPVDATQKEKDDAQAARRRAFDALLGTAS